MSFSLRPPRVAHAHCDIPCGIYDPEQARIEAESCYKIIEKYHDSDDEIFRQRCVVVKEGRAELVKQHLDVLWHDYFKPEHLAKFPRLHDLFWKATKQTSKVKEGVDLDEAHKLLEQIDEIGSIWEQTGGPAKTRVKESAARAPARTGGGNGRVKAAARS